MLKAKLLAGGGAETLYVDDVFGVWLRSGTGAALTINLGIDMTSGGLLWTKSRSLNPSDHALISPTQLGSNQLLKSNTTGAKTTDVCDYTFTSTGYSTNANSNITNNVDGRTYVDWVFRNADKFYNHTTVVKSGGSNATVSFANLATLGMVRVKRTDSTGSWYIWHRSLTAGKLLIGETTAAAATLGHITVSGTTVTLVNGVIADGTYLVEGFAHDTGTDGLIQCGSYTGNGSATGPVVTLGYEPQYLLIKDASAVNSWYVMDQMRNIFNDWLVPNTSAAEVAAGNPLDPTATGFEIKTASGLVNTSGNTYIYLAIRRPNKPPTTGTQVYNAIARTGTGAAATVTGVGFAPDLIALHSRSGTTGGRWEDRLRGATIELVPETTAAETTVAQSVTSFSMDGFALGTDGDWNTNTATYINHFFKRAPGVFDVVCDTGTGAAHTVSHSLGSVPELMIRKKRSAIDAWYVYAGDATDYLVLNTTAATADLDTIWNDTAPTSTVFTVGTHDDVNASTATFVTYLFATLAGISKVGSYTGTATTNAINCGFTTGARFVMIKRTDSTGDWYVWDTTRGIIAGNDPYLLLNSTAAEVTGTDYIDPSTSGFELSSTAPAAINASGGTFIYLAFA